MTIYGLDERQHAALGSLIYDDRTIVRRSADDGNKRRSLPYDSVRVMCLGPDFPIYNPRASQSVAYFVHDLDNQTVTIEMFGDDLAGNINVWINDSVWTVNCQLGTQQLRSVFGFALDECRITAFPGLWEFAFFGPAPFYMFAAPGPGYASGTNTQYPGGCLATLEAWRSVYDSEGNLDLLNITDMTPFREGEVKPGAIARATWSDSVPTGWLVDGWKCREFRFYPG